MDITKRSNGKTIVRDGEKRVAYAPDPDVEGMFEVWEVQRGNRYHPVGSVFREMAIERDENGEIAPDESGDPVFYEKDTWTTARHTYKGVPAEHTEDHETVEEAALALWGAWPFHGKKRYRWEKD